MSLKDELDQADKIARRSDCAACVALNELPDEQSSLVEQGLSSRIGAEKLAGILRKHEIQIGRVWITRHREEGHGQ